LLSDVSQYAFFKFPAGNLKKAYWLTSDNKCIGWSCSYIEFRRWYRIFLYGF